jgi:hypothetical protein
MCSGAGVVVQRLSAGFDALAAAEARRSLLGESSRQTGSRSTCVDVSMQAVAVREICVTFCGNWFCQPSPSSVSRGQHCQ